MQVGGSESKLLPGAPSNLLWTLLLPQQLAWAACHPRCSLLCCHVAAGMAVCWQPCELQHDDNFSYKNIVYRENLIYSRNLSMCFGKPVPRRSGVQVPLKVCSYILSSNVLLAYTQLLNHFMGKHLTVAWSKHLLCPLPVWFYGNRTGFKECIYEQQCIVNFYFNLLPAETKNKGGNLSP